MHQAKGRPHTVHDIHLVPLPLPVSAAQSICLTLSTDGRGPQWYPNGICCAYSPPANIRTISFTDATPFLGWLALAPDPSREAFHECSSNPNNAFMKLAYQSLRWPQKESVHNSAPLLSVAWPGHRTIHVPFERPLQASPRSSWALAVLDGQFEIRLRRKCLGLVEVGVDVHLTQYAFIIFFILSQVKECFQKVGLNKVQGNHHNANKEAEEPWKREKPAA